MKRKIPVYKSIKFKITLLVSIIFLLTIVLLLFKSNQNQQEMIGANEEFLNQIAVDTIDRRFKVSYEILETGLAQVVTSPLVSESLFLRDEENLYGLVEKSYEKLHAVGVNEFNFFLPDGTIFLNVIEFDGSKSLDSCERSIVDDINSDPDHLPIKGIEECKHGLFLRYIAPIYIEDEYIGSAEIGMEIGSRILNIFKNVSGGEWYLYSLNGENHSVIESTIETDTYPLEMNSQLLASIRRGEVLVTEDSPYIIQMIPISNYKGEYNHYIKRNFDNRELINLQDQYSKEYVFYGIISMTIGLSLLWIVMKYFLDPLIYLEQRVRKFESGAMDEVIEVKSSDEIGYLAGAMENMRLSLYKRESDLKEQSFRDPLTGVYNRLYLENKLDEIVEKGLYPITFIVADIDGLKQINDKKGHAAGDKLIIDCTEIMKSVVRGSDKVIRMGGDEFVLLFPKTDYKDGEYILKRLEGEIEIHNNSLRNNESLISISFGLESCDGKCENLKEVIALADKKMYEDKARKNKSKNNN